MPKLQRDISSGNAEATKKIFPRECRAKNCSESFTEATKKVVLKERSVSLTKLQKAVPKGAQCKFSAQKSFLRECRAKYRRNRRRRSSKDVP
jgi:hypothetical protein